MNRSFGLDLARDFRRSLVERGQASITLTVDDATSTLLRDLAQQHDQSVGAIVKAGALIVRSELARREGAAT